MLIPVIGYSVLRSVLLTRLKRPYTSIDGFIIQLAKASMVIEVSIRTIQGGSIYVRY